MKNIIVFIIICLCASAGYLIIQKKLPQRIISGLPGGVQEDLTGWLMRTGLIFRMPVFKMLLRSMEFFGADQQDLKRAFSQARDLGPSLIESFRALAHEKKSIAESAEKSGDAVKARDLYYKASLYYLIADIYTYNPREVLRNYELALPCFDRFRSLSAHAIQKIRFPFGDGMLAAHFRTPEKGKTPFPAVVIIQGNDTVKEWITPIENIALERGIATLTIDPPGWGESGLSGNRFRTAGDMKKCMSLAVDYLRNRKEIGRDNIGVFGFSLGGLFSLYCAGLESRFAAVATIGAPYHGTINELWKKRPIIQQRRGNRYTGHATLEERDRWMEQLDFNSVLSKVRCPALLVHGENDDFYPINNAYKLAGAIKGKSEVRIIKGGDHMCTGALPAVLADVFLWFSEILRNKQLL